MSDSPSLPAANPSASPRPAGLRPAPRRRGWLGARRLALLGLLAVILVAAAHTALWFWMAGRLHAGAEAWEGARRAQGWRIEHAAPVRGGWPFSVTLRMRDFRLSGAQASLPGGIDWSARSVTLRVPMHRPGELRISAGGPQRLRLGATEIPFAADRLTATLPLERDVLPRGGEFEASRLRIGTAAGNLELEHARLVLDSRMTATEGEPAFSMEGEARRIQLPVATSLGRQIDGLSFDASLSGPVPGARSPANRAALWRDGGGTLELSRLTVSQGETQAELAATLALDDRLQPMGAGTLKLTGADALLAALERDGLLTARNATLARRVAGLLARPPAEGEAPRLEVPVTLERQSLAVARLPIARLPDLLWPAPSPRVGPGP